MSAGISPPKQPTDATSAEVEAEFERRIAEVKAAALEWGLRWREPEGRFQEVPLLDALPGDALRVVGLFCTGPERADLDYLEQLADGMFMPPASMIILNAGLVLSGRSSGVAFAPILAAPAVKQALGRGARVAAMPSLTCMAQVTDRGLTFEDAMNGHAGGNRGPLSLFDRARVNRWWSRDVPEFFDAFPTEWLPLPSSAAALLVSGSGDRT